MVVVLFRSRLTDAGADGYEEMAAEMEARARSMPGFVDMKFFTAADGERLTIAWWQDEETMAAWRGDGRHLVAQRLGREKWYASYNIEVAHVVRARNFIRPSGDSPAPSPP
jgi:heme-degrading monooxygenase HmoA